MKKKILYEPLEMVVSNVDDWKENVLIYHFFEIMQILEGEGVREVNRNKFQYNAGDIFLFTPLDCRGFESNAPTKFCSIRFSEMFLTSTANTIEKERLLGWLKQLEQLFYRHNRSEKLAIDNIDRQLVTSLISNLTSEYTRKLSFFEENIQHMITLILNTLVRNIPELPQRSSAQFDDEPLINKMLLHVKEHIQFKEKLSISFLSRQFHLSSNYVGEYFKKMTGESLQHYIMVYKMRLVENKLRFTQLTLNQIADELGFSDESHLSKQFKKYSGFSPVQYRRLKSN
jgi:AraC-like DNA-binding protein